MPALIDDLLNILHSTFLIKSTASCLSTSLHRAN